MGSKSKKKPPPASCDGHESRRWRKKATGRRAIGTSHASNSHSSGAPPRYAQFASRSMEYSEKNFKERISSSRDNAVTSAAPLWATASANSGTVALSPKSSAFKGSRTAARSAVGLRVGVRAGRTRAVAQEVTSSSFGNLALRLPRVVAARIAAEAIAAQSIAVTNTQDSLSLLAKQACLSSLLAFPSTLVCHTLCLKSQDWIMRGGMRLVARTTLSFEGGRVNWQASTQRAFTIACAQRRARQHCSSKCDDQPHYSY